MKTFMDEAREVAKESDLVAIEEGINSIAFDVNQEHKTIQTRYGERYDIKLDDGRRMLMSNGLMIAISKALRDAGHPLGIVKFEIIRAGKGTDTRYTVKVR
jgi:hypothetical protein